MTGPSLAANNGRLLRYVLADLRYPARWWEIMAMAEMYGVAAFQHAELARLPRRPYGSVEAILHALTTPAPAPGASSPRRRETGHVRHAMARRTPGRRHRDLSQRQPGGPRRPV